LYPIDGLQFADDAPLARNLHGEIYAAKATVVCNNLRVGHGELSILVRY
jgi:hypothetical protein